MTEISSPLLSGRLWAVAVVLAVALVAYVAGRIVLSRVARPKYAFPERVADRAQKARKMLYRLWRYVVAGGIVLALLAILPQTFGQALALTGVAGALIVLATQALFRDVIAGFSIVLEGQLSPGDRVRLFGVEVEGIVEDVGLRITVVREDGGSRVFVPNGSITAVRAMSGAASAKPADASGGGRERGRRGDGGREGGRGRRSRDRRGGGRRAGGSGRSGGPGGSGGSGGSGGPGGSGGSRGDGGSGGGGGRSRSEERPPRKDTSSESPVAEEPTSPAAGEPGPPREVLDESPWSIE